MATKKKASSKKVSIEVDPETACDLADLAHKGIMASAIFMAKSSPKGKVTLEMESDTARELSKKINEKLKASGAFMG
jgi:predicted PilT family ATPase